jgi:Fe-S-cluster containining protein
MPDDAQRHFAQTSESMITPAHSRLTLLKKIYRLYDDFMVNFNTACRKGCDLCCTANVTLTTLEGLLILKHLEAEGMEWPGPALETAAQGQRFQPALTINAIAALCLQDKAIPEEAADPASGPCPLLHGGGCTIYAARPFGCRAMVSRRQCARGGAAEMPELVLSANHLVLQFIEAIDLPGLSGNLTDVLRLLASPQPRSSVESGPAIKPPQGLTANQPIPALMVPPEHRDPLRLLIQTIQGWIAVQGQSG